MRRASVVACLCAGFLLAGCAVGGSKTTTVTVTRTVTSSAGPKKPPAAEAETGNVKYFGIPKYVSKLDAKRYVLAIKPELFLVGVTANVAFAAQQQNACQPLECPAVEDDRWVIPAGNQNLLFVLPVTTKGTVINRQQKYVTVTAARLSRLVGVANPPNLLEGLESGLWVTVDVDTVTSFAQQYQP